MYAQEVKSKDLVLVPPSKDEQIEYLNIFCEKQHNQISALVFKIRELERKLIESKKGSHESQT